MAAASVFNGEGGTITTKKEQTKNVTNQIGSSNQSFDLGVAYVSGSLRVYWNGMRQTTGTTITEAGNTFSTSFIANPGDELIVDYQPV